MFHPSLLAYIKSARAMEMATAVIRSNLVGAGWNEDEVDSAIIHVLSNHSDKSSQGVTLTRVVPFSYVGVALIGGAVLLLGIVFGQVCFWLVQPRANQSVSSAAVPALLPSSIPKTKPVASVTAAPTSTAATPISNL